MSHRARLFHSSHSYHTDCGAHLSSYPMATDLFCARAKRPGGDAEHLTPCELRSEMSVGNTTTHSCYVITQESAVLIYVTAEARIHSPPCSVNCIPLSTYVLT